MTPSRNAFTLIELLIVISIITILAGVTSKLWLGQEKINKALRQRATHSVESQSFFELLRRDVLDSQQAVVFGPQELRLAQVTTNGQPRTVTYRQEGWEWIRGVQLGDQEVSTQKVFHLDHRQLLLAFSPEGLLRVEVRVEPRETPMLRKDASLITYIRIPGGRP